jgi:hypothetical protein
LPSVIGCTIWAEVDTFWLADSAARTGVAAAIARTPIANPSRIFPPPERRAF